MMEKKKLIIDFWGDITCPFCYIGEVLLERELQKLSPEIEVNIRWNSCLLLPDFSPGKSFTWAEKSRRTVDPSEAEALRKKMSLLHNLAEKYELRYNLENAYMHNSRLAARLLKVAAEEGKALELATAFGCGYFSDAIDYSKEDNLRETAASVGLPSDKIDAVFDGQLYYSEVVNDQELATQFAYNYIPTIYFNGSHKIEGLLTPQGIRKAIDEALQRF